MNTYIISIIVPVYKAEKSIGKCIESVLAQSFAEWEMILVDDGSPDKSREICDEYALKDKRIKVYHKENGGPSSARNLGLKHARGKYVWFVDSDDWIEPSSLNTIYQAMWKDEADICFFGLNPISNNKVCPPYEFKNITGDVEGFVKYNGKQECGQAISKIEMNRGMGWTCNKWFRNSIITEHDLRFDERFSIQEDHIFTLSYLMYVNQILITTYKPYNYVMAAGTLLGRKHPFLNTKQRNDLMYAKRLEICKCFSMNNPSFVDWFSSDYASRMVSNLLNLKDVGLPASEKMNEIDYVKDFIHTHKVDSPSIRKFRLISWLPRRILCCVLSSL